MSEMIARVAEAIRLRAIERGNPIHPVMVRHLAAAAIEAMREPTKDMIEAGHRADPLACDVSEAEVEYCYGTMYRAMIDEARK